MTKISDLQQKRAVKLKAMKDIFSKAEAEQRERNQEEISTWETLKKEAEALNKEIADLEEMEKFTSYGESEKKELNQIKGRFDLSKAIRTFHSGLDGVEKEVHQIGVEQMRKVKSVTKGLVLPDFMFEKQNFDAFDTTAGAGEIETAVKGYDTVAAPSMLQKLGVTVYNGLDKKISLPFSKGFTATKLAEGGSASQSTPTKSYGTLDPTRFQGWELYSNEFLSVSSTSQFIARDMIMAIDRAVFKDILTQAVTANVLTGHATSATGAALTWKNVLKLLAGLETDTFNNPAFVMSKELLHDAEGIEKAEGSGRFIVEAGKLNGEEAHGSSLLPVHDSTKYDIVFGDWSRAFAGYFGGYELQINPYEYEDEGQTKITFVRLGDTAVNPYAFASIRNATLSE